MRAFVMMAIGGLLAAMPAARAAVPEEAVLLEVYLQTHVMHLVATQIDEWSEGRDEAAGKELDAALQDWSAAMRAATIKTLNTRFGSEELARKKLTAFVSGFTTAEKQGDMDYLASLSGRLGLEPPPADFAGFRQAAQPSVLSTELGRASAFLSAVEAWLGKKDKNEPDLPDLATWLEASVYNKPAPKAKKAKPANPLADAEAGLGTFTDDEEAADNPFDEYRASRAAKRKRVMDQARDGMSLVANERQAAEQEASSKKLAAAQAEAAAMQKHAEKLAAVEQQALEQRQNSWTSKLKNIVSTTVSTATGVFMGSVGQRAGEAVTDAIFNDKH